MYIWSNKIAPEKSLAWFCTTELKLRYGNSGYPTPVFLKPSWRVETQLPFSEESGRQMSDVFLTLSSYKFTVMGILKPHQAICCDLNYPGVRAFFLPAKLCLFTADTSSPFAPMTHVAVEWHHVFFQPSLL